VVVDPYLVQHQTGRMRDGNEAAQRTPSHVAQIADNNVAACGSVAGVRV
jgi:hypothetical protein